MDDIMEFSSREKRKWPEKNKALHLWCAQGRTAGAHPLKQIEPGSALWYNQYYLQCGDSPCPSELCRPLPAAGDLRAPLRAICSGEV